MFGLNRMRSPASAARSRTRGWRTATGPMPVMIARSGKCPWRDSSATILGLAIGVAGEKIRHLGLNRAREQHTRALTQDFGEQIGEGPWLRKLENASLSSPA